MLPQTVLAEDSAEQVNPKDSTAQTELTDSAGQIDPADESAPNNTTDSAEISESIFENRKEKTVEGVPANDAETLEGTSTHDSVSEAPGNDADTDAAASNVPASPEIGDAQDSVLEAGANDIDVNAAASNDTVTEDNQTTDDADTKETKASTILLQSAEGSLTAGEYPSRFDLRDLGRVTPVKMQLPWGTCWAFGATAAAETSILTKMDSTYEETGLDLSERYLAWYVAQPVSENISSSQAGEGLHLYDENPNNIFLYGGKGKCAGTLFAQGIGPVPESEYPYRGLEGNLYSEALLTNKDAFIENCCLYSSSQEAPSGRHSR